MAFGFFELSRTKGRKIGLYLFRYGASSGSYYAYTNHTKSITRSGITYTPVPIKRGRIVSKSNLDKTRLDVRTSLALPLAELFRIYPPSQVVTLTISELHLNDTDNEVRVIWSGRVTSASREGRELILGCEPIRTATRRMGLRRHYQYSCPHVLFSTACGANKAAATVTATVASVSGTSVTLASGWTTAPLTQYVSGTVEWTNAAGDTETRAILSISGDTLQISGLLRDVSIGTSIKVIRGCARTMVGCNEHSNILNFGGCPYIPTKTPLGRTSVFY